MQFTTSLTVAALGLSGLGFAQDQQRNLTALLTSSSDVSALTALVSQYPDVLQTLASATNITILAPNNAALAKLNQSVADSGVTQGANFVQNLLQYHVVKGVLPASAFTATPAFAKTLLTDAAYTNVTGGQVVDGQLSQGNVFIYSGLGTNAKVVTPNLNFTGGVVHVIDGVLNIPAKISTTAAKANLSTLTSQLTKANLVSTLDNLKDVTVFAPTNRAFEALGSAAASLTVEQLTGILGLHVINGTVGYSSALKTSKVRTLAGTEVQITVGSNGTVTVNNARVTTPNILVANGVVHVIDAVISANGTSNGTGSSGGSGGSGSTPPSNRGSKNTAGSLAFGIVAITALAQLL